MTIDGCNERKQRLRTRIGQQIVYQLPNLRSLPVAKRGSDYLRDCLPIRFECLTYVQLHGSPFVIAEAGFEGRFPVQKDALPYSPGPDLSSRPPAGLFQIRDRGEDVVFQIEVFPLGKYSGENPLQGIIHAQVIVKTDAELGP